jgi:hypothetical protein
MGGIMNYRKTIISAIAVFIVCSAGGALAKGMYTGIGIGNTFFSSDVGDAVDELKSIDENSTAWKVFGGFHGSGFIGVEGGYRSFGSVETTVSDQLFKSKTSGWDVEALGRFQVAIIDIFGKAGAMFWSTEVTLLGSTVDDSGTDFFWGLGAGVHLGPIGARLEWETVEGGGPDNLSMVSLSATLGF